MSKFNWSRHCLYSVNVLSLFPTPYLVLFLWALVDIQWQKRVFTFGDVCQKKFINFNKIQIYLNIRTVVKFRPDRIYWARLALEPLLNTYQKQKEVQGGRLFFIEPYDRDLSNGSRWVKFMGKVKSYTFNLLYILSFLFCMSS